MKSIAGTLILWFFFFSRMQPLYGDSTGIDFTHKIRGAFWGIQPVEQGEKQLRLLKRYGFNTALVSDYGYTVKEHLWPGWGKTAEKYGIKLFPIHCFAGTNEIEEIKGKYTPYVDRNGRIFPSTPCPLDAGYWFISIAERFEKIACISKLVHISGVLFDTEMYGGDFSIYHDFCFCDICWKEFIQTMPFFLSGKDLKVFNLAPEKRFKYLRRQQLLQQYADYQEKQIEAILSRIEKHIHNINPDLLLGFLGYRDNWFYRGLIRGLGTQTRPVLVFSESSYIRGYTPYVTHEKSEIMELRRTEVSHISEPNQHPIARYIPGLWQGRFFPEDIPSQLYNLAANTDGYWVFSADSLWDDTQKTGHYTLHGSRAEYWTAFKKANDALCQFVNSSDTSKSNLPPVYLSSFYDSSQNRLVTQQSLKHFLHYMLPEFLNSVRSQKPEFQQSLDVTYRGTTLFHGLKHLEQPGNAEKTGQSSDYSIQITHIPLETYSDLTTYKLFNEHGRVIQEGSLSKQNPSTTLRLPSMVSRMFSLLTDSGTNLTKVSFSGFPFVVEASSTFPLKTSNVEYTYVAYVKPGKTRLTLRAYCFSCEESASIIVQSPGNKINKETEIVEFTEINIPTSTHNESLNQDPNRTSTELAIPNFWTIAITPVFSKIFEDIQWYFYNEEFPYLIIKNVPEDGRN